MSYTQKTGTGLKNPYAETDGLDTAATRNWFSCPQWMSDLLDNQDKGKSAIVQEALMAWFADQGKLPDGVEYEDTGGQS